METTRMVKLRILLFVDLKVHSHCTWLDPECGLHATKALSASNGFALVNSFTFVNRRTKNILSKNEPDTY